MNRSFLMAVALTALPLSALAMPSVGDLVGTNPTDATVALAKSGCTVTEFEAEKGKIEAKCTDTATGKLAEVYIDPKSGVITDITAGE